MELDKILELAKDNLTIFDAFVKTDQVINSDKYKKIFCSISGGSDSDIMLDILTKVDYSKKITYVWFNTGIEFQATKDHLKYLEQKYGIEIVRERAIKPIPLSNRLYGEPFLSKHVSEMIFRAQKYNFKFEDKPYEELLKEYPKMKVVVKWWCNKWSEEKHKTGTSRFDIQNNKYLKEFLVANPPTFRIANKCCTYAKKNVAKNFIKTHDYDLNIFGVRKAEGGIRASAYKSCFTDSEKDRIATYRPLWWFSNEDKREYEKLFDIKHSDCYEKYGMVRTGCAGCPFNIKFEEERETIKTYEPKLYKAIDNIFKESHQYTRAYRKFALDQRRKDRGEVEQLNIFDFAFDEGAV